MCVRVLSQIDRSIGTYVIVFHMTTSPSPELGYTRVGLVIDKMYMARGEMVWAELEKRNIEIVPNPFFLTYVAAEAPSVIEELKKNDVRVVIVVALNEALLHVMCAAQRASWTLQTESIVFITPSNYEVVAHFMVRALLFFLYKLPGVDH